MCIKSGTIYLTIFRVFVTNGSSAHLSGPNWDDLIQFVRLKCDITAFQEKTGSAVSAVASIRCDMCTAEYDLSSACSRLISIRGHWITSDDAISQIRYFGTWDLRSHIRITVWSPILDEKILKSVVSFKSAFNDSPVLLDKCPALNLFRKPGRGSCLF